MPLSEEAKKSLEYSEQQNIQLKALQAEQEKQAEQERQRLENEINQQAQQEAELQRQLAEIEAEEKRQLEIQAEKQRVYDETLKPYETEIQKLTTERNQALNEAHHNYWKPGGQRDQGMDRTVFNDVENEIEKYYNSKIRYQEAEYAKSRSLLDLHYSGLPEWAITKASRNYDPRDQKTSAVQLAQNYVYNKELKAEYNRRSSIKTAQSNAVKERENIEYKIRELQAKKDQYGYQVQPLQKTDTIRTDKKDEITRATKKIPQVYDSSFFRKETQSVIPDSIKGTNAQKSQKAYTTFDKIQKEQQELFQKVRSAKSTTEASEIIAKAKQENPYLGTANVYLKNGKVVNQEGVLIEKRLEEKLNADSVESDVIHLKQQKQIDVFKPVTNTKQELEQVKTVSQDEIIDNKQIPQYQFIDDKGNEIKLTQAELFRYVSYLSSQSPQMPSELDKKLNQYIQENKDVIIEAEKTDIQGAEPIQKGTLLEPFTDYGAELHYGTLNIFRPEDQQIKYKESLEGVLTSDLVESGKYVLSSDYDKYVQGEPELKTPGFFEQVKTPEGLQYVALSGLATAGFWYVTASKAPALALSKHGKYLSKETQKIVAPIVEKLKQTPSSLKDEELLKKFPDLPAGLKEELITRQQNIVGVEMLDPRTALIIRGTEGSEPLTPYVIVKNTGRRSQYGKLYQTYDYDKPGQYREILVSGVQKSELEKGTKITKDIVSYPATRQNVMTVEQTDKLARVGSSEKVGIEGLKETPQKVIEKIETQKVKTGTVITETERLNPVKSLNKDVQKIEKPDTLTKRLDSGLDSASGKSQLTDTAKKLDADLPSTKGSETITIDPVKQRTNEVKKLKETIKATETQSAKSAGLRVVESSGVLATTGIRSAIAQGQQNINLNIQGIKASQQLVSNQQTKIKTELETKSEITTRTRDIIKIELEKLQKQRPSISPRYSLIVDSGLDQRVDQIPKYKLITTTKQKLVPEIPPPPPPDKTTVRPPTPTTFNLSLDIKQELTTTTRKKLKPKISYFRWNTNTQSVGQYLPTQDLSTGRTRKVIEKVDRLERRVNQPNYYKKLAKKEAKYFKLGLDESRGSLTKKANIRNISKPQGKQARKFLKKFSVNVGF